MNVSRLRADIDSGKTGDKSPGHDPAAAPLGTDDEAAGTPVPRDIAEQVRAQENRVDGEAMARQNASPAYGDTLSRDPPVSMRTGLLVVSLAAALSAFLCVVLLLRYGNA